MRRTLVVLAVITGALAFAGSAWAVEIGIKSQLRGYDLGPPFPAPINPYSRGVIPVAILGSDTFDVAEIDVATLRFGPAGAEAEEVMREPRGLIFTVANLDVNGDGFNDLIVHFQQDATGLAPGDTEATLTGQTLDGTVFEGSGPIIILVSDYHGLIPD